MPHDDKTGQDTAPTNGPVLTHPQCINTLQDLRDQMSQIAELKNPSEEDDRYFEELARQFDEVDAHRRDLERKAQLARVKGVANDLSGSRYLKVVPGAYSAPGT